MAGSAAKKPVYLRGIPTDVIREAKAAAARRGVTLAGFVADTLSRAVRESAHEPEPSDDLGEDMEWYARNRARLARTYDGQYVAVVGKRVIDSDRDFERLAARVFEAHGHRSVFMPLVAATDRVLRLRSPRVRRKP